MTINKKALALVHTGLCVILLPLPGLAQESTTGDRPILEELIVTAQKREQNLQDVPVGVSLLSGKSMQEAQIKNAAELATLLPTLNVQASSGSLDLVIQYSRYWHAGVQPRRGSQCIHHAGWRRDGPFRYGIPGSGGHRAC